MAGNGPNDVGGAIPPGNELNGDHVGVSGGRDRSASGETETFSGRQHRSSDIAMIVPRGYRLRDEFVCPITRELIVDPVIAADGHTYDRPAIEEWLYGSRFGNNARGFSNRNAVRNTSPKTGQPLEHLHLIPNHNLKRLLRDMIKEGGSLCVYPAGGLGAPSPGVAGSISTTKFGQCDRLPSFSGGGSTSNVAAEVENHTARSEPCLALIRKRVLVCRCLGPPESDWNGQSFRFAEPSSFDAPERSEDGNTSLLGGRRRPNENDGVALRDFVQFNDATVSRRHFEIRYIADDSDENREKCIDLVDFGGPKHPNNNRTCISGTDGEKGYFVLRDMGSAGGTFVRIPPKRGARLCPGMMVMLGKHQLVALPPPTSPPQDVKNSHTPNPSSCCLSHSNVLESGSSDLNESQQANTDRRDATKLKDCSDSYLKNNHRQQYANETVPSTHDTSDLRWTEFRASLAEADASRSNTLITGDNVKVRCSTAAHSLSSHDDNNAVAQRVFPFNDDNTNSVGHDLQCNNERDSRNSHSRLFFSESNRNINTQEPTLVGEGNINSSDEDNNSFLLPAQQMLPSANTRRPTVAEYPNEGAGWNSELASTSGISSVQFDEQGNPPSVLDRSDANSGSDVNSGCPFPPPQRPRNKHQQQQLGQQQSSVRNLAVARDTNLADHPRVGKSAEHPCLVQQHISSSVQLPLPHTMSENDANIELQLPSGSLSRDNAPAQNGCSGINDLPSLESADPVLILKCFAPEGTPIQGNKYPITKQGATLGRKQGNSISFSHEVDTPVGQSSSESGGTESHEGKDERDSRHTSSSFVGIDSSISGEHATVTYDPVSQALQLFDGVGSRSSSTNGTWIRLSPMHKQSGWFVLEDKMEVLVGTVRFQVNIEEILIERDIYD